jgi:hypothetical protein
MVLVLLLCLVVQQEGAMEGNSWQEKDERLRRG